MKPKSITIHAGRTLPHPQQSYANIKSAVSITADLDDGEDLASAVCRLQTEADKLITNAIHQTIADIRLATHKAELAADLVNAERQLNAAQDRLNKLKTQSESDELPAIADSEVFDAEYDDRPARNDRRY